MNAGSTRSTGLETQLSSVHRSVPCGEDGQNHLILKVVYDENQLASVTNEQRLPVVVFLNGADCSHESYMWLASRLAYAGYCVALSSCVMTVGPKSFLLSHTFDMNMLQSLEGYKKGPSNAGIASIIGGLESLNSDEKSALSGKLDLKRIIMGGHSAGARTVLDLVAFDNPFDIVAAFSYGSTLVVSNAMFAPASTIVPPEATKPPPLLLMSGTEDGILASTSKTSDATEGILRTMKEGFQKNPRGDVDLIIFNGANHMVFTSPVDPTCGAIVRDRDLSLKGGEEEFRQVVGDVILNFLESHGLPDDDCDVKDRPTFQPKIPLSMVHMIDSIRTQGSSSPELSIVDLENERQEEVWKRLSSAVDSWISTVVSELGLQASTRLADNVRQWNTTQSGEFNLTGSLEAWDSSSVDWAVRYANTVMGPKFGSSVGFNVWLNPSANVPHLTLHMGVRNNRATLIVDHLPRCDLAVNQKYLETFYGGDRSLAWSELQKSKHVHSFPSVDPALRALQSPNALAMSVPLGRNSDMSEAAGIDLLLDVLADYVTSWMGFVREATSLDEEESQNIAERDTAIRRILCDHERAAGERIMGVELSTLLANSMAGLGP